jgi:AbrB family looped-hinge helix DNA binding protein
MSRIMVKVGSNGRFVIPSEFRKMLGVEEGDELLVRVIDGEMRITTPQAAIARAQRIVRRYVPADHSLVEELAAERREAAANE